MNWLAEIGGIWMAGAWWWIGFCAAFLVLTRFSPCNPGRNWWHDRRAAVTDMLYWLVMPLVGQMGRAVLLLLGVVLLYGTGGTPPEFALRSWPLWCQCLAILLLQDVMMYWIHRVFHTKPLWSFHAVHHSSETLDWTSAVRFHPVNSIAEFAFADAVILLMGFSPIALAILGPVNLIYSVMVHANLNWTFGPLKYVFASPVFHRWHHTTEEEGLDRNFAPTFPFLDLMFGTFFMPARKPEVYGTNSGPLPTGFLGQMAYPFRKPVPAMAGLVVAVLLGWFGYTQYTRPMQKEDMAEEIAQHPTSEPALLKLSQRFPTSATSVAADAAGSRLVFGSSDGRVTIRNTQTGAEQEAGKHNARVNVVAVSPKGAFAVSAAGDGTANVIRLNDGVVLHTWDHNGSNITAVAVNDDGWVATGSVEGILRLWHPTGETVKTHTLEGGSIHAVAVCDGGTNVAVAQGSQVTAWETGADRLTPCEGPKNLAYCVAIRADGGAIAAGEYDGRLHLWSNGSGKSVAGHTGPIYSMAFEPGSGLLVTGGADKQVRIWNADGTMAKEFDGHPGLIFSVSFDGPRQRLLAAGKDLQATGWNLAAEGVRPVSASMPK